MTSRAGTGLRLGSTHTCKALMALVSGLLLGACTSRPAPLGPGGGSAPDDAAGAASSVATRVVLANGIEVSSLATKLHLSGGYDQDYLLMSNSPLVVLDPQGAPVPRLAVDLPSQGRGTWIVNADGTMATTWKIRPNAVWHDGEPVTAKDVAFAFRVYTDDAIQVRDRHPERFVDRVELIDPKTFTIHWRNTYPRADRLLSGELEPLPEHLVGGLYESGDRDAFENASFWSSPAYVGAGPYRLVEWDKGIRLVYRAFEGYFLGRPKINEVVFQVVTDVNTVPAMVLSGAVDATVAFVLNEEAMLAVKKHWARTVEGQVVTYPVWFRAPQFQLHPARTQQPALLDLRVRRGIAHAVDRAALVEAILGDPSLVADIMLSPSDPLFPRAQQIITKYPFDRARALGLLGEAGWSKRGDQLVDSSGQRFALDIMGSQRGVNIRELSIIAGDLRALGVHVTETPISPALAQDREYTAQFGGLQITTSAIDVPRNMSRWTSDECRTPQNRFSGNNSGCWMDPEYDRLFRVASTTLDEGERAGAILGLVRVHTEQLPVFGDFYHTENIAVRKGLVGLAARWPPQSGHTWNVHEWHWAR